MRQAADDRDAGRALCTRRAASLLLGSCIMAPGSLRAATPASLTPGVIARSQLASGDPTRLQRAFARASRGEPITLGVIGGSITGGARASRPENSYATLLLAWWRARFPRSQVRLVNAGIGGTGSMYGALRAGRDLLPSRPDVVVVEFAVNDAWTDGEAFEGLVRQMLAQPNAPAVVLLFMMWQGGGNTQDMHAKVGMHYRLPMVSFRDALWPEMAAGRLHWADFLVDEAHPNDAGHAAAARFVTTLLDTSWGAATSGGSDAVGPLPPPLHSDVFQFVDWRVSADLTPVKNMGWSRRRDQTGAMAWVGTEASGRISFDWSGTGLVAVLERPPDHRGGVRFWVDGVALPEIDAANQPNRAIRVLARGLGQGRHSVEIERLDHPGNGTSGEALRLIGLAGIGLAQRDR